MEVICILTVSFLVASLKTSNIIDTAGWQKKALVID